MESQTSNVHLVFRTTKQVNYRNVHLVFRTHEQTKYRIANEMH
jgi:hypothetical protein